MACPQFGRSWPDTSGVDPFRFQLHPQLCTSDPDSMDLLELWGVSDALLVALRHSRHRMLLRTRIVASQRTSHGNLLRLNNIYLSYDSNARTHS